MQEGMDSSLLSNFFHNKWVRLVLLINVVIVIVVIVIAIYNNTKSAIITFDIAPIDAKISVNGNTNYTNGTFRMLPGKYDVVVSRDGLDSKSFNIDLASHSSTLVAIYLSANGGTDFSFYEMRDNSDSARKLLTLVGSDDDIVYDDDYSANSFVSKFGVDLDLFDNKLPLRETVHESPDVGGRIASAISIEKSDSCEKYLCISVKAYGVEDVEKRAKELLEGAGFDLNYLEVKYEAN